LDGGESTRHQGGQHKYQQGTWIQFAEPSPPPGHQIEASAINRNVSFKINETYFFLRKTIINIRQVIIVLNRSSFQVRGIPRLIKDQIVQRKVEERATHLGAINWLLDWLIHTNNYVATRYIFWRGLELLYHRNVS